MSSRPAAGALALSLSAALLGCHKPEGQPGPDAGAPPVVTVARVAKRPVTKYAEFTGTIQAKESVQVRARVSGYIEKVNFVDGTDVKEGDVLFEIDPVQYRADLDAANAAVASATAQLAQARAEEARELDLFARKASAANEKDVAVAKRGTAEAALSSSKAQVTKAKQNLDWTKVTAPISGRVDRVLLTRGNVATGGLEQGTVLTNIVSLDPVYAYLDADEQSVIAYQRLVKQKKAASVADGQTVPVEVQLAGETGYPHKGTMDFVSNQLAAGTGTLTLRCTLPNKERTLLPGFYVKARAPVGGAEPRVVLPDEAVLTIQGGKAVYVVGDDNKVVEKEVTLGALLPGGERVVESGLEGSERVIVRGLQRVGPGQPVEAREAGDKQAKKD